MPFALRRAFVRATFSTAAVAVAAAAAHAQAPVNPFGFGVSAGAAVPTGDAGDAFDVGYSIDGIITLRVPTLPVSFRGEVGYTRFALKERSVDDGEGGTVNVSGNQRIISGVANAVLSFPAGPTAVVRPYLIGGVGLYNGRASGRVSGGGIGVDVDSESETRFGLNGGIGIEIPLSGITGFGEVRYTSVFTEGTNTNFLPIRFGIRF